MTNPAVLSRRSALAMAVGLAAAPFCPLAVLGDDMSPEAFRNLVIAAGARRYPLIPMQPVGQLEVTWHGHHLYLQNAYAGIRMLPPELREAAALDFLSRFTPEADARVDSLVAAAEKWDDARNMLRPKLLPAATVLRAPRIVHQPFSTDVVIGYAIDLGDKDLYVDQRRVAKWRMPLAQVHATALENLESMSTALPTARHLAVGKGRLVVVDTNDGCDAARLLLPGLRSRVLAALGTRAYAGIPGRDFLTFWAHDVDHEKEVENQMQMFAAQMPHSLTGQVFAVDAEGVRPA